MQWRYVLYVSDEASLFFTYSKYVWIHTPVPITAKEDEDAAPNCLACKTEQHGFPEMTTAESNTAHRHAAHRGLFLESVNNRCLTRKRIPSVTLSNGGLALFLKHKKENTTNTQKLPQMKQTSQRPFSQNKKFLSDRETFSVWHECGGNVLLNITVKYSVAPTIRHYYINGDWLQKDSGTKELREWQLGSQTAVKDDATRPTTHSLSQPGDKQK